MNKRYPLLVCLTYIDENFAYLQQYSTENLEDGYDYVVLYEVDFFKYIPENAVVDDSVVVEDESVE